MGDWIRTNLTRSDIIFIGLIIVFAILSFGVFSSHYLESKNNEYYSASTTWGDIALHLALSSSFAERGFIATMSSSPIYAGTELSYHFVADYISGLLIRFGFSHRIALLYPSFLFVLLFMIVFYIVARKILRDGTFAVVLPWILIFNGNLFGIYYLINDSISNPNGIWHTMSKLPRDYGYLPQELNIHFSNVFYQFFLPQRAFALGLIIGLIALYFLWVYWNDRSDKNLFMTTLVMGLLPLVHSHTLLLFILSCLFLLSGELLHVFRGYEYDKLVGIIKRWVLFFILPIASMVLPQLLLIYPHNANQLVYINFNWTGDSYGPIIFWLKNLSGYIVLYAIAYIFAPAKFKTFFNAFFSVFVITNIVVFQPNMWDNFKLVVWFVVICTIMLGFMLDTIYSRYKSLGLYIVFTFILACSFTGILSFVREAQSSSLLYSQSDINLSNFILSNTDKNSVFLTSTRHNNPVFSLAGRQVVMGYEGWLKSYGLDYDDRSLHSSVIYTGLDMSDRYVKKYNIDYIVIDDYVKKKYTVNEEIMLTRYPIVYDDGIVQLLGTKMTK